MNLSENDEAKTLSRSAIGNSIPKIKEDCETKIHHDKIKYVNDETNQQINNQDPWSKPTYYEIEMYCPQR